MPLIKSASKKALKENIETEMDSNPSPKDRKQNLAIAYNVQRTNKKKMASGGKVTIDDQEDPSKVSMPTKKLGDRYEGDNNSGMPSRKPDNSRPAQSEIMAGKMPSGSLTPENSLLNSIKKENYLAENAAQPLHAMAEGGEVCSHCEGRGHMMPPSPQEPDEMSDDMENSPGSIAEQIISKNSWKRLANGGEIDDPFDNGEGISHFQEEGPGVRMKHNVNAREYNAGDDRQLSAQPEDSNETGDMREDDEENKNDRVSAIRAKMKSGRS